MWVYGESRMGYRHSRVMAMQRKSNTLTHRHGSTLISAHLQSPLPHHPSSTTQALLELFGVAMCHVSHKSSPSTAMCNVWCMLSHPRARSNFACASYSTAHPPVAMLDLQHTSACMVCWLAKLQQQGPRQAMRYVPPPGPMNLFQHNPLGAEEAVQKAAC